jgi:hypothetical protein
MSPWLVVTVNPAPPVAYENLSDSHEVNSGSDVSATFNVEHSKFSHLTLNGVVGDPSNYHTASGSTIVTLHAAYLSTLPVGTHTFTVHFSDGTGTLLVTISAPTVVTPDPNGNPTGIPTTGGGEFAGAGEGLLVLLLLLSPLGIAAAKRRSLECR